MSSILRNLAKKLRDHTVDWRKSAALKDHIKAQLDGWRVKDKIFYEAARASVIALVQNEHPATLELAKTIATERIAHFTTHYAQNARAVSRHADKMLRQAQVEVDKRDVKATVKAFNAR